MEREEEGWSGVKVFRKHYPLVVYFKEVNFMVHIPVGFADNFLNSKDAI